MAAPYPRYPRYPQARAVIRRFGDSGVHESLGTWTGERPAGDGEPLERPQRRSEPGSDHPAGRRGGGPGAGMGPAEAMRASAAAEATPDRRLAKLAFPGPISFATPPGPRPMPETAGDRAPDSGGRRSRRPPFSFSAPPALQRRPQRPALRFACFAYFVKFNVAGAQQDCGKALLRSTVQGAGRQCRRKHSMAAEL